MRGDHRRLGDRIRVPPARVDVASVNAGKRSVLGVLVDVVDYDAAAEELLAAARERRRFTFIALAVHGVMTGVRDRTHNARLNAFDIVAPDGQPVRWALNILYDAKLSDWVSGPHLVLRVLQQMAEEGLAVYLYGSTPEILDQLSASLTRTFSNLRIAGKEPSKFRGAEPGEDVAIAERIIGSGASLVLVGLGCPRQETFTHAMSPLLDMPMMAVGAAFDYHAGRLRPAPVWMQHHGLAWLYRLILEPRRLWRRYLVLNVEYLLRLIGQKARVWKPDVPAPTYQRAESFPV